ncbi:MAG TPA: shikimate dehydrogenase [Bacteroidota bacterium]
MQSSGLRLYGIIGHPIAQSLSPLMHNANFESLGIHASMQAYDIEPQSLNEALQGFLSLDFGGLNVTIPHKETIIPLLDEVAEEAGIIGAVNTVRFENGKLAGFNTDARGFMHLLEPLRSSVEGAKFMVLGAGGAARAVVYVLLKHIRTNQIAVVSRTAARATEFTDHFRSINQSKLSTLSMGDPSLPRILQSFDVIINATPVGMFPETHAVPIENPKFHSGQIVIDLIYRPMTTQLLRQASEDGARAVGGVEMFLQQGAEAFRIWTGQTMDIRTVRSAIISKLEQDISASS